MKDYSELRNKLKKALEEAFNIGLTISPNGGYAMSYSKDKLPPYAVGLFGALSIIMGPGARSRLGLSYDETIVLEDAFRSRLNVKKPRLKKLYPGLDALGHELRDLVLQKRVAKIRSTTLSQTPPPPAPLAHALNNLELE